MIYLNSSCQHSNNEDVYDDDGVDVLDYEVLKQDKEVEVVVDVVLEYEVEEDTLDRVDGLQLVAAWAIMVMKALVVVEVAEVLSQELRVVEVEGVGLLIWSPDGVDEERAFQEEEVVVVYKSMSEHKLPASTQPSMTIFRTFCHFFGYL